MHPSNERFWLYVGDVYGKIFTGATVYEFGSQDVGVGDSNVVRRIADGCDHYVGIDWRDGPAVDLVSLAHNVDLPPADIITSASMLEHDPYWEKSIIKMVELLKPNGMLVMSWGSALNLPHNHDHSPDGQFLPLKAGAAINLLQDLEMDIVEFMYESTRFDGGHGEVCLIAFKGPQYNITTRYMDDLLGEDVA